jgi:hypothetical protein
LRQDEVEAGGREMKMRPEVRIARETMIQACVSEAALADERGNADVAEAIRRETLRLAKRLTPETYWYGLGEPKPENG